MPRIPVDGRTGSFPNLEPELEPVDRPLNVRGDSMPVSRHPAESIGRPSFDTVTDTNSPVARPLEPATEQPALREPGRGGVSSGTARSRSLEGPSRSATPVSEHHSTGSADRARYDDGTGRYDWDVRRDGRGDYSGRAGAGVTHGNNDLDLDVGFDEASGDVDARLRAGRRMGSHTEGHVEVGVDGEGVTHGRVGASHELGGGHSVRGEVELDRDSGARAEAAWSHSHGNNREDIRATVNERGASAEYSGRHSGEGWHTEERLSVDSDGNVRGRASGEFNREVRDGTRLDARGHVSTDGDFAGHVGVEHRVSDRVTVSERLSINEDGVREHTHGARVGLANGNLSGELSHDSEGRGSVEVEGSVRHAGASHAGSVRVSGEEGDPPRVEGRYTYRDGVDPRSARTHVETEARLEGDGRWRVGGDVRRRVGENVTLREGLTVDSSGRRSHEHGVEVNHPGHGGRSSVTVRHNESGDVSAEAAHRFDRDGRRGEVRVGLGEDGARVEGELNIDGERGNASVNAGWREGEGVRAEGSVSHRVGEDTELSAGLGGNSAGHIHGEVRAETRLGADGATRANVKLTGNNRNGAVGGEVNLTRSASGGLPGGNVTVGLNRDDSRVEGRLAGGVKVADLFGIGANGRVGADARVTLNRRRPADRATGWVGDLREDVLSSEPDSRYVAFGARGRATVNAGVTVPLGTAYVNAGYERGETYDVEVTRLTEDARLGERPSMNELNVDNSAEGVLGMRPGESFRITGETTHTTRGGGGLGKTIASGAGADVKVKAGVDVTYVVSGNTSLDVTRGGDGTARVVVANEESTETRGGLNVRAGVNLDYAKLADSAGMGELPDVGPAGSIATSVARGVANRWMSATINPEHRVSDGDRRLLDVRLDLSDEKAGRAYDEAVRGDWSALEEMARSGHRAVDVERSIFTELNERATPLTITGLGMGYHSETREELRESEVNRGGGRFEVTSEVEKDSRKVDGWFSGSRVSVTDVEREVRSIDGADLGEVKASEHWLSWNFGASDTNTSREELLGHLTMVERMLGDNASEDFMDYRDRVAGLSDHRRFWIGPRNELRDTNVSVHVEISREGLGNLRDLDADDLWARYDQAWRANNPALPEAPWDLTEDRHVFMDPTTAMYEDMAAENEENSRKAVLEKLAEASRGDEETRVDTTRELLAAARNDTALMSVIVELVGATHAKISLNVDSTLGSDGKAFDFQTVSTGADFDVQKKVFGEDL